MKDKETFCKEIYEKYEHNKNIKNDKLFNIDLYELIAINVFKKIEEN
jgi:hypothetical protein